MDTAYSRDSISPDIRELLLTCTIFRLDEILMNCSHFKHSSDYRVSGAVTAIYVCLGMGSTLNAIATVAAHFKIA